MKEGRESLVVSPQAQNQSNRVPQKPAYASGLWDSMGHAKL